MIHSIPTRRLLGVASLILGIGLIRFISSIPSVGRAFAWTFAELEGAGAFRPVFWFTAQFSGSPISVAMIAVFTAGSFVWFLRRLSVDVPIAMFLLLVSLWHPLHDALWNRLNVAECLALPFALLALGCAQKAASAKSVRIWDCAWIGFAVLALFTRNSFVGIIPAAVLLRLGPDEIASRGAGFFQHYRGAVLCGAMLLLGGVGLSSTLGVNAKPELVIVGLGLYVLFAALVNGLAEWPLARTQRLAWVSVGVILVMVMAWNLTNHAVAGGKLF